MSILFIICVFLYQIFVDLYIAIRIIVTIIIVASIINSLAY